MEGICIKLLYASFLSCYIATASIVECGHKITPFIPIYEMSECPMSNTIDKFIEMLNSGPVKTCK